MSNTRFGVTSITGTLVNGDGTAPPRSETSPYVMERTQDGDRRSRCYVGAANQGSGASWEFVFDLGSSKTIHGAAALGVVHTGITQIECGVYSTYASAKTPLGNLIQNGADWGLVPASPPSGRYWYFNLIGTGLSSVTDFKLFETVQDLGLIGQPDFASDPFRCRTEHPQADFSVVLNDDAGRMGHDFAMEFVAKDLTALGQFEALIAVPGSIVLFDDRDRTFEIIITGGRLPTRRSFSYRRVQLNMQRLP